LFFIGMLMVSSSSYAEDSIKVTFLNPDPKGNQFWDLQTCFMEAAAADLGIDLKVVYSPGKNRFEYMELAEKILTSGHRPDYFIGIFKKEASLNILQMAEKNKVRFFSINTDVPEEIREACGAPREKFMHWIGQMIPDDTQAGYELARILIEKAEKAGENGRDRSIQVVGLSGSRDSSAALDRNKGLQKAVEEYPDAFLHQIVFTDWDQEEARLKADSLFVRYPALNVIWCASDRISMGAVQAIEAAGKIPGKQVLTGGIDWSKEGRQGVKSGKMEATLGGHFMEGALALVLLYDYHHGKDFATELGVRIPTRFHVITAENVDIWDQKFHEKKWDRINFKKLSKIYNPARKKYNFDLQVIFGI